LSAQQTDISGWREYSYPEYGFAVKASDKPHESGTNSGTQYRLYWDEDQDVVVNLTAERVPIDCAAWEKWAKTTFKHSGPKNAFKYPASGIGSPVIAYSAAGKVSTLNGETVVEADPPRNAMQDGYQLHECVNGHLYHFETGWKKGNKKPEVVGEVIKTFRILPTDATK
jgi:hypothetical protein